MPGINSFFFVLLLILMSQRKLVLLETIWKRLPGGALSLGRAASAPYRNSLCFGHDVTEHLTFFFLFFIDVFIFCFLPSIHHETTILVVCNDASFL